jgi:hypothetical protein
MLSILAHETSAGDLSRTLRATPASYALSLTDGTGANQAQIVWSDSRTLAASSETLNMSALADTRDGASVSVAFSAVKAMYVRNSSASALALSFLTGPLSQLGIVNAGGAFVLADPTAAGTLISILTVTGAAGATYDIVLIGEGTVT